MTIKKTFKQFVAEATVKHGDVITVDGRMAGYHGKVSGGGTGKPTPYARALKSAQKQFGTDKKIEFHDFDEYQAKNKHHKEEFVAEAANVVKVTNSEGHSIHTDGKKVWTSSGNKGAAAPPALSNFSANHSVGTEAKRKELHAAVLAGHASAGKEGVVKALKKHGHQHHNWK